MFIQDIGHPERLSYTVAASLGSLHLWIMPRRESSSDPPSDLTDAVWIYEDEDSEVVRVLHSFQSAQA